MTNKSASISRARSSLARSLSMTASTPAERAFLSPPTQEVGIPPPPAQMTTVPCSRSQRIGRISKIRFGAGDGTTRRIRSPSSLERPALSQPGERIRPRRRRRTGPTNLVGSAKAGSTPCPPRSWSGPWRTARRPAGGCRAPARSGSRSFPRSARPRHRAGRDRPLVGGCLQGEQSDLRAIPVGEHELVAPASGASTCPRRSDVRPLGVCGHGLTPAEQGVAPQGDQDCTRRASAPRAWRRAVP